MALVGYIRGIWPTITNVLYNAMRHNLPHVINHTPELLFPCEVCRVFPQSTVPKCPPKPFIIFAAFCVVRDPCRTAAHRLKGREGDTRRSQAEDTGPSGKGFHVHQRVQLLAALLAAVRIRSTWYRFFGRGELVLVVRGLHLLAQRNVSCLGRKVENGILFSYGRAGKTFDDMSE